MKSYRIVKIETIEKMMACFSSESEYQEFGLNLNQLAQELQYLGLIMVRDSEKISQMLAKQTFNFAMFCRDNIELIQELVKSVNYSVVSEEYVENLVKEGEIEKDWK